jgi:hypothetical protein
MRNILYRSMFSVIVVLVMLVMVYVDLFFNGSWLKMVSEQFSFWQVLFSKHLFVIMFLKHPYILTGIFAIIGFLIGCLVDEN